MPGPQQLTLFGADAAEEPRTAARRLVQLGTRVVEFRFARSRRRTIGISIDADGLAVAAPYFAPWVEIERFLLEKARWILKSSTSGPRPAGRCASAARTASRSRFSAGH